MKMPPPDPNHLKFVRTQELLISALDIKDKAESMAQALRKYIEQRETLSSMGVSQVWEKDTPSSVLIEEPLRQLRSLVEEAMADNV